MESVTYEKGRCDMVGVLVRFRSPLSAEEALAVVEGRLPLFRGVPGLLHKFYLHIGEGEYGGFYVFESREAARAYRDSDLARGIIAAYRTAGPPQVEVFDIVESISGVEPMRVT